MKQKATTNSSYSAQILSDTIKMRTKCEHIDKHGYTENGYLHLQKSHIERKIIYCNLTGFARDLVTTMKAD